MQLDLITQESVNIDTAGEWGMSQRDASDSADALLGLQGDTGRALPALISPDSRVRPRTDSLQGPAPMALKACICSSYSVHSSSPSTVSSLSSRSLMTWASAVDGRSGRQHVTL